MLSDGLADGESGTLFSMKGNVNQIISVLEVFNLGEVIGVVR